MSLILDALNRSRRDAEPVPGLDTYHAAAASPRAARAYLPWIALACAALLIAWLLWDRSTGPEPAVTAPIQEAADNVSSALASVKGELQARAADRQAAAPPAQEPAVAPPQSPAPASAPTASGPAQAQQVAEDSASDAGEGRTILTTGRAAGNAAINPAVAELYERTPDPAAEPRATGEGPVTREPPAASSAPKEPAGSASGDTEEPVDLERLLQSARDEMENARLVDHPAPFIAELSQQTKDAIPTLYYQRHDYSGNVGSSSVVLNGKSLRVGGSPVSGMKVDEILPDSVILSFQGKQFRLRALNSWINL